MYYTNFCVILFFILSEVRYILCQKISYNTFPTTIVRSTTYSPKVIDKTCLLIPDVGPCRAGIPMHYFDPKIMNCSVFMWGGCQGNGNRFDTNEECESTCLSKPNRRSSRPKYCDLSFDYGFCFGSDERWYYDHIWKTCKKTIYSGCGGNKNNFYSREMCESVCRFGHGPIDSGVKSKGGIKKKIVINPWDATKKHGRNQKIEQNKTTLKP